MTEHLVTHPTPEQLRAFSLGQLPDEDVEAVESHISECQPCCETVLGLSSEDTFVALLQDAHESPIDETAGQSSRSQDTYATGDAEIPLELAQHPRYSVVGRVGKGGMGDVFIAEHRMMERMVALKVIKRELFSRPEAVQRFRREVKTAAKLSHPNIVTAFDAEQAGAVHFLVMEYVNGVDLARLVKDDGPLSITAACDYIRQAARGLQHAHEQGMVHRDIKPHNLMLSGDGTVKILDFGLATLAREAITVEACVETSGVEPVARKKSRLTTLGTMMGTPDFISPEQANEPHEVDIRSDIYGLGCTFYYLLSGRPPFVEGSVMEKVQAHANLEVEPIESVRVDIPSELADVVRRMMAKDPAERFQTPAEVADSLASFVHSHSTMLAAREQADHIGAAAPSRRSWWPPTIVQLLALAVFALIFSGIIYVATDGGTLSIESEDEHVQITVRPVSEGSQQESTDRSQWQYRIDDTLTGSSAKWLRSGVYQLELQGNDNDFELSPGRFVIKRGGEVVVTVTRRKEMSSEGQDAVTSTKILVSGSEHVAMGLLSPDETKIAYRDFDREMKMDVVVRDLRTGKEAAITQKDYGDPDEYEMCNFLGCWSPDSQWVAYQWWKDEGETLQLRIAKADGSETRVIKSPDAWWPSAWSPNGKLLACSFMRDGVEVAVLLNIETGESTAIPLVEYPEFSPDGQWIAGVKVDNGNGDVQLINVQTRQINPLFDGPTDERRAVFSKDGRYVLFSSDQRGEWDLWAVRVDDGATVGNQVLVKSNFGGSPNGTYQQRLLASGKLAYRSTDANIDVCSITIGSDRDDPISAPKRLSRSHFGKNSGPSWSPDGSQVAYRQGHGICIQTLDSGKVETIDIQGKSMDLGRSVYWSPDGQHLAFKVWVDEGTKIFIASIRDKQMQQVRIDGDPDVHGFSGWSWDGTQIYATIGSEEIRVAIDVETGKTHAIDFPEIEEPFGDFHIAPNGEQVLVVVKGERGRLVLLNRATGHKQTISDHTSSFSEPRWSPNGEFFAYFDLQDEELVVMSADTKSKRTVPVSYTPRSAFGRPPAWSPDSKRIAFSIDNRYLSEIGVLTFELP